MFLTLQNLTVSNTGPFNSTKIAQFLTRPGNGDGSSAEQQFVITTVHYYNNDGLINHMSVIYPISFSFSFHTVVFSSSLPISLIEILDSSSLVELAER